MPTPPSNWLRSDGFHHNNIKRIDITVNYSIAADKRCASFKDSFVRQKCKEQFDVYEYQATENSNDSYSIPTNGHYNKIKTVSLPSNISNKSAIVRTVSMSLFIKEGTSLVFLAIHDQGACFALNSFLVTYNVCPRKTLPGSLVLMPETIAPMNKSEIVKVAGKCADNSEPTSLELAGICQSSGEWIQEDNAEGKCLCKPGWEKAVTKCQGICVHVIL